MSLVPYVGRCVTCGHNHGDPFAAAPTDAGELLEVTPELLARFKVAARTLIRGERGDDGKKSHPIYAEDLETLVDVLHVLEALATQRRAAVDEAMVERAVKAFNAPGHSARFVSENMREALVAALQEPK